jgi:hypothetical protein
MKTLINSPESVLEEMLEGLAVLDPGLARMENFPVLLRADAGPVIIDVRTATADAVRFWTRMYRSGQGCWQTARTMLPEAYPAYLCLDGRFRR